MNRKTSLALLLLAISLLVTFIPVIPHHHHADGTICMKADIAPDCSCDNHRHDHSEAESHRCGDDCITNHFFDRTTHTDELREYCTALSFDAGLLFVEPYSERLLPADNAARQQEHLYRERLHGIRLTPSTGLRAPPTRSA